MFATGETVGLAQWIIDDTCLVMYFLRLMQIFNFLLLPGPPCLHDVSSFPLAYFFSLISLASFSISPFIRSVVLFAQSSKDS